MLLIYDSLTGNTQAFAEASGMRSQKVSEDIDVHEPFIFVTYTIGFGDVPDSSKTFLDKHHAYMQGVASSGNKIWGGNFAKAADTISQTYGVPVLAKFELRGTPTERTTFQTNCEKLASRYTLHSS